MQEDATVGVVRGPSMELNMANQVDYNQIGRFYANHAQINLSLFEIRLLANFVTGINSENGHLMASETMMISMSPEMAETVHRLLGKALEAYQRDYGPLRSPKSPAREAKDETASQVDHNA